MTTARKLWLGFGTLIGVLLIVTLVNAVLLGVLVGDLNRITLREEPVSAAAYKMQISAVGSAHSIMSYLETGSPEHRDRFVKDVAGFERFKTQYDSLVPASNQQELEASIDNLFKRLKILGTTLMDRQDRQQALFVTLAQASKEIERVSAAALEHLERSAPDGPQKVETVLSLRAHIAEALVWLGLYRRTQDSEYKKRIFAGTDEFAQHLEQLRTLHLTSSEQDFAADLGQRFNSLLPLIQEWVAEHESQRTDVQELVTGRDKLDAFLQGKIQAQAEQRLNEARSSAYKTVKTMRLLGVSLLLAGLLFGLLPAWAVSRGILKSEQALTDAEERSRLLLESTGEGIYGIDKEGNCTFANPACAKLLGYEDSGELLGKNIHNLAHHSRPDGSALSQDECRIYRALHENRGFHADDEVFWRKDATPFPVEYWSHPVLLNGERVGAVVTFVDVTRRRRTEEIMRLRERALKASSQGIFITDPNREEETIIYVNAAFERFTGHSLGGSRGRDIEFLCGPETSADSIEEVRSAYREDREAALELVLYRKDGSPFWATLAIAPVAEEGKVTHFVGVLTDISDKKRAEIELQLAKDTAEEANRAKSQFLANMSHELRTPLNAVIMYSELLQEEVEESGLTKFTPDLIKINAAGKHLLGLINDILDLSKIEAGKMELYLETFDTAQMIKEVVTTINPIAQKRENTLIVHGDVNLGEMYADLTKIRQILFNLLSNAFKFTDKGTVTFQAERSTTDNQDWITFRVQDTGIGMTKEQLGKLFQDFAQADPSTTRKYGGTGLGLAITRRLCEMMGGNIEAESESGKGTIFIARIPAKVAIQPVDVPSTLPEVVAIDKAQPRDNQKTVLVVDDDPAVRDLLTRFLAAEGYRVITAVDGEEGLEFAHKERPDVITLDVMMPKKDGWAVLSALKENPDLADIPVIMMTFVDDKNLGFSLGASDYLTKPIDRGRLAAVLKKFRSDRMDSPVLIVEDDDATRQALRRMLENEGYTVEEAENGRVGLEKVGVNPPGLILLDLMMPEVDGFTFVAELKKNPAWRAIPVVVVTAKDLTAEDQMRLSGYVEKILQKGAFGKDKLLAEVREIVEACTRHDPEL